MLNLTGMVEHVEALGCGVVAWKLPTDTGGEITEYIARFFDGSDFNTENSTFISIDKIEPNQTWAIATDLPNARPIYVDVCYSSYLQS